MAASWYSEFAVVLMLLIYAAFWVAAQTPRPVRKQTQIVIVPLPPGSSVPLDRGIAKSKVALLSSTTTTVPTPTTMAVNLTTAAPKKLKSYKIKKEIIDSLFKLYEKSVRPHPKGDGPTQVSVSLFVRRITSVIEINMEFTSDILVRQIWNDPRFRYSVPANVSIPFIKLSIEKIRGSWAPDLFFPTEKRGSGLHVITSPNIMMRIYPNGDVHFSERYTMVSSCDFDLMKYPFDIQRCVVELGSFSETTESIEFSWAKEDPIVFNRNVWTPKYAPGEVNTIPCLNIHPTGNFSCLRCVFEFKRQIGYFALDTYIPLSLLVVASWLGFWIDASSVPGRVSLSVTTLLTTVAQATNIKHGLPPVSYVKAIDVWLGICVIFVFAALFEFAVVNYLSRRKPLVPKEKRKISRRTCSLAQAVGGAFSTWTKEVNLPWRGHYQVNGEADDRELFVKQDSLEQQADESPSQCCSRSWDAQTIDRQSRCVFPLAFGVIVAAYFYLFIFLL